MVRLDDTVTRANLAIVTKGLERAWRAQGAARSRARRRRQRSSSRTNCWPRAERSRCRTRRSIGERKLFELRRIARDRPEGAAAPADRPAQRGDRAASRRSTTPRSKEIELIERELEGVRDLWKKNLDPAHRADPARARSGAARRRARPAHRVRSRRPRARSPRPSCRSSRSTRICAAKSPRRLREIDGKIGEFVERKVTAEDQLKRIDIRAPQDGTVFQSNVHTVGGVITAGEPIMLIVPEADNLDRRSQGQSAGHRPAAARPEGAAALLRLQPAHHAGNLRRGHAHLGRHHRPISAPGASYYTVRIAHAGRGDRPARRRQAGARHAGRGVRADRRPHGDFLSGQAAHDQFMRAFREDNDTRLRLRGTGAASSSRHDSGVLDVLAAGAFASARASARAWCCWPRCCPCAIWDPPPLEELRLRSFDFYQVIKPRDADASAGRHRRYRRREPAQARAMAVAAHARCRPGRRG